MSTVTPAVPPAASGRSQWVSRMLVREMWASLAIISMWMAVLFDALFGPNLNTSDASGTTTSIPSALIVALFAYLGTRVVARYGFSKDGRAD